MEREIHNVILFGAGASVDAGIPAMAHFIDKMWDLSVRGKVGEEPIADKERQILKEANAVRQDLERYHSRASFDDRNLEDLLSLISFDAMQSESGAKQQYEKLVQAIAVTIELCCRFKYRGGATPSVLDVGGRQHVYNTFWLTLLQNHLNNLPAIITFNYDLVLERTLWEAYHRTSDLAGARCPESMGLRYYANQRDMVFYRVPHSYKMSLPGGALSGPRDGSHAVLADNGKCDVEIPYLKLHGSLNWFDYKTGQNPETEHWHPTGAVSKPLILPPVFNKLQSQDVSNVWTKALEVLRQAKHLIIVGYSLPRTDIYMQYFLKAAVGPNSNLSRVFVFNPSLWNDSEGAKLMKDRYADCFSAQFKDRIEFHPESIEGHTGIRPGTLAHFVGLVDSRSNLLFFKP